MKISSAKLALPLAGLLLAGLYVSVSGAQDQPPTDGDERVEVVIPDTGVVRRQLDLIAPSEGPDPVQLSPFAGKVVVLETADSLHPPYEGVEIQRVAGHHFFVIEGADEGQTAHQFWLAVDKVQSIRVFNRTRDAEQFLRAASVGR